MDKLDGIKTIIFDLDGTLIDTSIDIAGAVNHSREQVGLERLPVATIVSFVGSGVSQLIEKAVLQDGEENVAEMRDILIDYYSKHLLEETTTYPGIKSLLEGLTNEFNLAVATNKPVILAEQTVHGLGLNQMIKFVAGPETAGAAKPNPKMLQIISDQFGTKPHETLMVGDSPIDVEVAKNFGCKSCAVTWGFNLTEILKSAEPDILIHDPLDLLDYI